MAVAATVELAEPPAGQLQTTMAVASTLYLRTRLADPGVLTGSCSTPSWWSTATPTESGITTAPTAPVGRTAAVHAAPGFTMSAQLSSIDGAAGVVDTDGRWWQSVHPVLAGAGLRTSAATTPKVWLDGQVEAALAESVPLIGAPAAWDAGYDGAGMTVAVLDTGIDRDHPDLVGKVVAERNFAEFSDTADDRHGHGTHVAGIVAGSGAASDGAYVGVAPGVELINAKVLDDYGNGFESDIIAGMEWAAAQGADVINMSLGGAATDGTDPMSQAVNRLTDEYDVLFVIAAGNSGAFGDYTVGAPGAAAAALTVGSVDKSEQLASTSSKGPRVGDHAIKPDVTAPGVSITAAKAEAPPWPGGGEHYTTISGTSMAAPRGRRGGDAAAGVSGVVGGGGELCWPPPRCRMRTWTSTSRRKPDRSAAGVVHLVLVSPSR